MQGFLELGVDPKVNQQLRASGIAMPTPIQEQSIPSILAGDDVILKAQTGTGKTLAFVLPMLKKVDPKKRSIQALIVTPTRELALQVTNEVKKLASVLENVNVLAVYGGQDVDRQLHQLNGNIHIMIATPGRLLDHLRRGTIELSHVSMLVLDEADQMLHIGFLNEVEEIIDQTPKSRQTILCSATIPKEIRALAKRYMKQALHIEVKSEAITVKDILQIVIETTDRKKQDTLCEMLDQYRPFLAIIFCRTKRKVSKLNEALKERGYNSDELHGDLSQAKREQAMKRFREAQIQFLVATDVAARGLDVEGVTHVFNYDVPQDVQTYIHRIGRTGRAGGKGLAITLIAPKDRMFLDMIEKGTKQTLKKIITEPKQEKNVRDRKRETSDKRDHKANSKRTKGKSSSKSARSKPRGQRQSSAGSSRPRRNTNAKRKRRP